MSTFWDRVANANHCNFLQLSTAPQSTSPHLGKYSLPPRKERLKTLLIPLWFLIQLLFASSSSKIVSKGTLRSHLAKNVFLFPLMLEEIPCNCSKAGLGWATAHLWLVRSDPCPSCSWPPHSSSAPYNTDVHPYGLASHSFLLHKRSAPQHKLFYFYPHPHCCRRLS